MKFKLLFGALSALLALAALHIWINVGVDRFVADLRGVFSGPRDRLVVGFLPVT